MKLSSRRTFIRRAACAALGTTGLVGSILDLRKLGAATYSGATDFKALVCVFLYGGNDGNNMLVPYDASSYASYAAARTNLAIPWQSLLPLALQNGSGLRLGFHPSMSELQTLFNQGKLAIVANVGTLVAPVTKADVLAGGAAVPLNLFSHSDQEVQWQTSVSDRQTTTGWGGRAADLLNSLNNNSKVSLTISIGSTNMFEVGNTVFPYRISSRGPVALTRSGKSALQELLAQPHYNLFEQAYADTVTRSIGTYDLVGAALARGPVLNTSFPATDLGQQLKMVARLVGARSSLGMQRQIFFCPVHGYDTHAGQLPAQSDLLIELSRALNAFYSATVEMGVDAQVTTFTASDFGRTFRSGGSGSDHAWGSHQLVLGGAVRGGMLYGTFPTLALGGPDDMAAGYGRWIPTTSVDEFSATMATWFGVANSDLVTVFPNIGRFANPNLGFLG